MKSCSYTMAKPPLEPEGGPLHRHHLQLSVQLADLI